MMNLVTFRQMLRLHDWGFGNSEDATTFSRGLVQEMRIEEALGILHARASESPLRRFISGGQATGTRTRRRPS